MTLFNKKLNRVAEESHEVEILKVDQNIQFLSASEVAAEKLLVRIGKQGANVFYRQDNDDKEWEIYSTDVVDVTMTETDLLTVTPTEELKPTDTSYAFYCKVDNLSNLDRVITFKVYKGTTLIAQKDVNIWASQTNKDIVISGGLSNVIAANSDLKVTVSADLSGVLKIHGNVTPTHWYIVKTYKSITINNFFNLIGNLAMRLSMESHANQMINVYDNTIQFGTMLAHNHISYHSTEDYFVFQKEGRIRFDLKLNFDANGGQERVWFWLEKKVGNNWVREHHEDVYVELHNLTEGLKFFSMFTEVVPNDKFRIRAATVSQDIILKAQHATTHDGTNLNTPSVKVEITQMF